MGPIRNKSNNFRRDIAFIGLGTGTPSLIRDKSGGTHMPIDVTLLAPKMRFVVVHYHIFKNAGTTVERVLEREFPGRFAQLHGPTADATLDGEDLAAFLKDHPGVQAVTSHHLRYPLPAMRHTVLFDCCFLRHPLDRLDSLYSYFRSIDSTDPLCRSARRLEPAEFMRELIDWSPEQTMNVQVTQLASRGAFTRPANEEDLDRAVRAVKNMALPGLVELFNESMVAAEYYMRPAFPGIRLGMPPANVSRRIVVGTAERERRLIQLWGRDLHEQLTRLNELDIELFRQTGNEIRRRLSLIPAVEERVEEFADRCRYAETAVKAAAV